VVAAEIDDAMVLIARSLQRLSSLQGLLSLLLLMLLLASCAACASFERPGEASFDEGARAYHAGRYDAAAAAFTAAARMLTRETDRARALHNLGNALARAGRDREALDAYRASLRLGDREATRRNHEIVRTRLPRPRQPPPGRDARDQRMFESARALALPATGSGPSSRRRGPDW
jgi:tetratricopeptide (TPR) repeat protein